MEKEDKQDKTQPSIIPYDAENEAYDSADDDESLYDDIFRSPASRDQEHDDTDTFRAYFYNNLRQGPTQQGQSVYSILAKMHQASAPENDQDSEYSDAFYRVINGPLTFRTAFDDAMVDHLYHKINSDETLESQPQRPRAKSFSDSLTDPMYGMGWSIAENSTQALDNASKIVNYIPVVGPLKQGLLREITPAEAALDMATDLFPVTKGAKIINRASKVVRNFDHFSNPPSRSLLVKPQIIIDYLPISINA